MQPTIDDAALKEMRERKDPEADAVACRLVEKYPDLDETDLVRKVLTQLAGPADDADAWVRDWITCPDGLPDWADPVLIARGQRFFDDWLLAIAGSLFSVSLPSAYAAADGAQVLLRTSDLATGQITRRTGETGQLLVDVMDREQRSPATLEPGGRGYTSVRGVRLLHAVVRQTILAENREARAGRPGRLWPSDWGMPVNQEDLLGTLLTFTTAVFHGLDGLGLPYDADDAEAYQHTWCVVGHLLGVDPSWLPFDREFGARLTEAIRRRHHRRSDAGERLMAAHLRQMELSMPWGCRRVPRTLVRHLLGDEIPDLLAMPPSAWWRPALSAMGAVGPTVGRLPGGTRLLQAPSSLLGRSIMRAYIDDALDGRRPAFQLDERTVEQLHLGRSDWRHRRRVARRRTRIRLQQPPPPVAARSNHEQEVA